MSHSDIYHSLSSLLLQRSIVIQGQLIHIDLHSLVEKDRRARLPLEVDVEHLIGAFGHPQNFKLHLSRLIDFDEILLLLLFLFVFGAIVVLGLLVDLLFALEVDLPDGVGDFVGLALDLQVLCQLGEDLFGWDGREEPMGAVRAFLVFLEGQEDGVWVVTLAFGELGVLVPSVVDVALGVATAGLRLDMVLHCLFAVLLLLGDRLVRLMACHEFLTDLLGAGEFAALEPGVRHDVWNRQSLVGVEVEHRGDQVLELLIEEALGLAVGVRGPELLAAVRRDQLVVRVLQIGHVEGRVASVEHEKDDAEGEEIDHLALIGLLSVDLGSHEAQRSDNASVHAVTGTALNRAGEAEIDHLDVVQFVEEDILALEVTVRETLGVNVVNRLNQLLSIVAHDALLEGARVRHIVEKLTSVHQLTHNVSHLDLLAIFLVPNGILIELVVLHHMLMVQRLHTLHLVFQQLESPLIEFWIVQSENLDSELLTLGVSAKFNFGAKAATEGAAERVLSDS